MTIRISITHYLTLLTQCKNNRWTKCEYILVNNKQTNRGIPQKHLFILLYYTSCRIKKKKKNYIVHLYAKTLQGKIRKWIILEINKFNEHCWTFN